ncbi:S-layer homology domain-containing protein [Paenibacillus haidiansis]|uniref:S-layer homology domain-containing protein n=1 Tax=Paenibacillus TaxID=44249 RepID=UPI0039E0AE31
MGGIRDAACPIFTGYGDGTFRPNMPISREEAAAINQPSAETARQCDGCEHVQEPSDIASRSITMLIL